MPKIDLGGSMDRLAQDLKDETKNGPRTQELIPVIGSWAMASAQGDNGQRGIAISLIPLNAEPFTIIIPDNATKDFGKHFRDALKFLADGKTGPVHAPQIIEGRSN